MASTSADSFQCGPFEVVRRPDASVLVDKLNRLREAVDQNRIQPGVGYTVSRSTGGTVLSINAGTASGQAPEVFPFLVTTSVISNDIFFRVHPASGTVGNLQIENLGKNISTGRKDLRENIRILLTADVASGPVITRLYLRAVPAGEDFFETEPGQLDDMQPQTRANIILATLTAAGVVQNVRTHLTYTLGSSNGFPALIFFRY